MAFAERNDLSYIKNNQIFDHLTSDGYHRGKLDIKTSEENNTLLSTNTPATMQQKTSSFL